MESPNQPARPAGPNVTTSGVIETRRRREPASQLSTLSLDLRLFLYPAYFWLMCGWWNKYEAHSATGNERLLCPQLYRPRSIRTYQIKLLHTMGGPCSEPTEHKTLGRSGEAQSVFNSITLGAQTQSMDGQCFPDVKFLRLRFQPYYILSCFFGRTFHSVGPGQKTEVTYLWFKYGEDWRCTQAIDVWTLYVKTEANVKDIKWVWCETW